LGDIQQRNARVFYGLDADKASVPGGVLSAGDFYVASNSGYFYQYNGAGWEWPVPGLSILATKIATDAVETLKIKDANVTKAKLAPDAQCCFANSLLHIQDQKATSVNGGTFTQAAWRTRDLTTVLTNEISGASLSSNQITLPAGTYFIIAQAPAFQVNLHKAKLRNTSDAADILIGTVEYTDATDNTTTHSFITGRFTLAAEKIIELQHYGQTTKATIGFGFAFDLTMVEVYSDVLIWKL